MASNSPFMLSRMPSDILKQIMKLLLPKDIIRLRALSKEWMNLCPSLPCLKLNLDEHKSHLEKLESDTELNEYVDTLLSPYKTSGLCVIHLSSYERINCQQFTQLFLSDVMKFSPRVIFIDMFISNFASISKIFTCKSVQELYLTDASNRRTDKRTELKVSMRALSLLSLRKLHIEFVRFYDELILSGCPVLEELSLKSCFIIISTESSTKLKFLSLDDCSFDRTSRIMFPVLVPKLFFRAPNLVSLKVASSTQRKTLASLSKIVYALNGHVSNNLFTALSGIQHLELSGIELKTLLDEELPKLPRLHNLKTLSLNGWCMDCHFHPVVWFLENALKLEKLTLWVNDCHCLAKRNSMRIDRVANNHSKLSQIEKAQCSMLKKVDIRSSAGYKKTHRSVVSFLRYAKVLEHAEISIYDD